MDRRGLKTSLTINVVQPGGIDQRVHHGGALAAAIGTDERPCGDKTDTLHQQEEAQANRFSAGLLMPKPSFEAHVEALGAPDVSRLQLLAETYDVSREAAANRYVELSPEMCAFVFAKEGRIRYKRPCKDFPAMSIRAGDPLPYDVPRGSLGPVTASDCLMQPWTSRPPGMLAQQIDQSDDYASVLLYMEADEFEDAAAEDDLIASYTRRFGR